MYVCMYVCKVCNQFNELEANQRAEHHARQMSRKQSHDWFKFCIENLTNRPFYSCVLSYLALNASEAGVDLALIQISHLFLCK